MYIGYGDSEKSMSKSELQETANKNILDREQRELLSWKISELSLTIKGTHLEAFVVQLYQELERAGISFKPKTYLTDEWGCPNGVPVIGIPFYLVDPKLRSLEGQLTDTEIEDDVEVMMYLRHEAGHAFNYAYRLHRKPEWRKIFGRFSQPYEDDYKPVPFSAKFVRHLPGWYAQKHPDDDFAETFAVWLTPSSDWRRLYADTPALLKLLYVDRMTRKYGQQPPIVTDEKLDMPVQKMTMTLDEWYEKGRDTDQISLSLHRTLNNDLRNLFPADNGLPVVDVLRANRKQLIREINRWTGMNQNLLSGLIDELLKRVEFLELKMKPEQTAAQMLSTSVFVTTLVMNYLLRGQFVET
jgi:hypothetical protein